MLLCVHSHASIKFRQWLILDASSYMLEEEISSTLEPTMGHETSVRAGIGSEQGHSCCTIIRQNAKAFYLIF